MIRRFFRGLLFVCALASLALRPAAAEETAQRFTTQITQRLHKALDGALRKAVARANQGEKLHLDLKMSFVDESDRVFLNLAGTARFDIPRAPAAVQAKVRGASGTVLYTNGSLAVDFCVRRVDEAPPGSFTVSFDADIVILGEPLMRELTRFGIATLGMISVQTLAGKLVDFFEGMDSGRLGEALAAGTTDITKLMTGDTAATGFDRTQYLGGFKFSFASSGVSAANIAYCVGLSIVHCAAVSGANLGGLTLGAAIGTALFPATGAAIGATIGGAGATIVGGIVISKVTVDVPIRYRLWRIQRARTAGDPEKAETFEEAIVGAVEAEMAKQKFDTLDILIASFSGRKPADLGAFQTLIGQLRAKLQFAILEKQDWSAARKYYQLLGAAGQLPDTAVPKDAPGE